MNSNVGRIDRFARTVIGFALLFAPLLNMPPIWSSQTLAYVSMALGLILLSTAIFGFCPLYRLIGVSTNKS